MGFFLSEVIVLSKICESEKIMTVLGVKICEKEKILLLLLLIWFIVGFTEVVPTEKILAVVLVYIFLFFIFLFV